MKISNRVLIFVVVPFFLFSSTLQADNTVRNFESPAQRLVYVDEQGTLRWSDTREEAALFGVNYYAPHYSNYADLTELGVSFEETIKTDLDHLVRMGMNAIRVHVFDREISDSEGNLVENEHLRWLDYLVAEAKSRGIYTILTPIAWWPTVNPNQGFSNRFSMMEMTTHPEAWTIQTNYLGAFMRHVNRFTGYAYKDEPSVAVFELINEPQYPADTSQEVVRNYIKTLCRAIRETGCQKPLFYNAWGGFANAVKESEVDGATFVWYPSGLVAGRSLLGNFLPRVDHHPLMSAQELGKKAKMVYEFDAADVPGGYLYPAMARTFRSAGVQIALQFQYDPLPLAAYNRGWTTHYLNLVYTPNRAVAMLIAGEVFRSIPRYESFGTYPENTEFGGARTSFTDDLAEYATDTMFYYSNSTSRRPPAAEKLRKIAGCGSSPIVRYSGTGAYFLDKVAQGLWRLEVYPDVVWIADPFAENPYGDRQVARVYHRRHAMDVSLPDLGNRFWITTANTKKRAAGGSFPVMPGVHYLHVDSQENLLKQVEDTRISLPCKDTGPPVVWCSPPPFLRAGQSAVIRMNAAGFSERVSFHLKLQSMGLSSKATRLRMKRDGAYTWFCRVPAKWLSGSAVTWSIEGYEEGRLWKFPKPATDRVSGRHSLPVSAVLFEACRATQGKTNFEENTATTRAVSGVTRLPEGFSEPIVLRHTGFANGTDAVGVRVPVQRSARQINLDSNPEVVVLARSRTLETSVFELALIQEDGSAYGIDVPLLPEWRAIHIPLQVFNPLWSSPKRKPDPNKVQEIQCAMGPWNLGKFATVGHEIEISHVEIQEQPACWRTELIREGDEIPLFDPRIHRPKAQGYVHHREWLVSGSSPNRMAMCVRVDAFGAPPSSVGFRNEAEGDLNPLRGHWFSDVRELVVRARSAAPYTDKVEVVLLEQDGSPWGTVVSLTSDWEDVHIPLDQLTFFAHWEGAPLGRGDSTDHFAPERVAGVHVCFGAWLYPGREEEIHALEIERISLK